jgi:hypothetical protein
VSFCRTANLISSSKGKCFSANKLLTNLEKLIIKFVMTEFTTTYVSIRYYEKFTADSVTTKLYLTNLKQPKFKESYTAINQ